MFSKWPKCINGGPEGAKFRAIWSLWFRCLFVAFGEHLVFYSTITFKISKCQQRSNLCVLNGSFLNIFVPISNMELSMPFRLLYKVVVILLD